MAEPDVRRELLRFEKLVIVLLLGNAGSMCA